MRPGPCCCALALDSGFGGPTFPPPLANAVNAPAASNAPAAHRIVIDEPVAAGSEMETREVEASRTNRARSPAEIGGGLVLGRHPVRHAAETA
jgi:hypothetical protein